MGEEREGERGGWENGGVIKCLQFMVHVCTSLHCFMKIITTKE